MRRAHVLAALLLAAPAAAPAVAQAGSAPGPGGVVKPGPKDKCPVCGMFVARHGDWLAGLALADGTRLFFDGPKDLVRFWLEPARFLPSRRREEVASLFVTDYYALEPVDARAALYVIGSDVLGPMGRELVPFARRADADEFARDHHGTRVVSFDELTPALVASLDG